MTIPVAPSFAGRLSDQTSFRATSEKAKQLLAEAGYPDGLSVDLYTSDSIATMVPIAQLYQQMAADAGIKVNIIMSPADSYWNEIWLKRPFITSNWGGRPTAEALSIAYLSKAQFPETHWYRTDYDDLIAKANGTVDADERRKIFQQAQSCWPRRAASSFRPSHRLSRRCARDAPATSPTTTSTTMISVPFTASRLVQLIPARLPRPRRPSASRRPRQPPSFTSGAGRP